MGKKSVPLLLETRLSPRLRLIRRLVIQNSELLAKPLKLKLLMKRVTMILLSITSKTKSRRLPRSCSQLTNKSRST